MRTLHKNVDEIWVKIAYKRSVQCPRGSAPERLKTVSSTINTVLASMDPLKVEASVWMCGVPLCVPVNSF